MAGESGESHDVKKDRDVFLQQLQAEVDAAYENRAIETEVEGTGSTVEQLAKTKAFAKLLSGKTDDELVNCGTYQKVPNEVIVRNPHDYKDLIEMAIRKFWKDDDFVRSETEEMLKHELEHHVALMGVEGVGLAYGVHFFQEEGTNRISFTRFCGVEGKAPAGLIRQAITNVTAPSPSDLILNGK